MTLSSKSSALSAGLVNASILLYTLWLLLPAAQTTGGAAAGVFCVALFGLGVLLDTPYLRRQWWDFALRALCGVALPLVFWFFLRRGGSNFWGYYSQQGMFWFPPLYCAYARIRQDQRLWRFLGAALLLCLAITALTTIGWLVEGMLRGDRVYAYSRSLGSGEPGREAYLKELMLRNIGGYDFVYATTLCLPLTCYAILRCGGWKRAGFALLCAAQLIMVALSQYTYALLFAAAIVGLELFAALARFLSQRLFRRVLRMGPSLGWALMPFAAAYLLRAPLVSWAASLCEAIGFSNFAYSLQQLLSALTGNAIGSASRLEYYRLPLQGILESPWLGSLTGGTSLLSQHSDILDLLSGVGLLGAAAVACMMGGVGRGALRGVSASPALPHLIVQWVILLVCALLGTVTYSRDISLVVCVGALLVLESGFGMDKTKETRTEE